MRPTLKAVTITYELNGHTWQKDVDLDSAIAVFWEVESMAGILSAYYKAKGRKLSVKQAVEGFGPQAALLFKKGKKRVVTRSLLRELWDISRSQPGDEIPPIVGEEGAMEAKAMFPPCGELQPLMVIKDPNCKLRSFI